MFLKQEQMKPTHLTQLSSSVYYLDPWARIYRGKTMVISGKHYPSLHVT